MKGSKDGMQRFVKRFWLILALVASGLLSVHALQASPAGAPSGGCAPRVSFRASLPCPDARSATRDLSGREATPAPRQGAEGNQGQAKTRRDGEGGAAPRDRSGYAMASLPSATAPVLVQASGTAAGFGPDAFAPQGLTPKQGGQTGPPEDALPS